MISITKGSYENILKVVADLEYKNKRLLSALTQITLILGPGPIPECCEGAEEEMSAALYVAKAALSHDAGKAEEPCDCTLIGKKYCEYGDRGRSHDPSGRDEEAKA